MSEFAHGSKGTSAIGGAVISDNSGKRLWQFGRGGGGGHQEEHHHLFADLRNGRIPNEGDYGAKSTLTSILGRMASYPAKKSVGTKQWNPSLNWQTSTDLNRWMMTRHFDLTTKGDTLFQYLV